ncbi:hypothetical protein I3842_04G075900 [Carya illinoinensis]|uniref:Uncharacterized protein n=1 Tax=Carya illinoinensis TaxID=32201 RepID=A0A922F6N3_CARIL|nr:hypothetical protein I3842_04G075900 [Carya illinoinensis]
MIFVIYSSYTMQSCRMSSLMMMMMMILTTLMMVVKMKVLFN